MAGLLNNSWFLCAVLFSIEVGGWSVWSNPELAAIEPQNKKLNKEDTVVKGITSELTLLEMHVAIRKLMFVSGMQNFRLPAGERRSVDLTMNLNDMDLDDINTFLRNPNEMNMMKLAKVMQRIFSPHSGTSSCKQETWFKDEKTIIEKKEKWVQIIFNIIISCMNKETMLVVTCLIMAVFIVRAMFFGADLRVVIGLFFLAVFFAGFLWNWSYMYQKAVVDQFVKRQQYSKYASDCTPDGGFWSFVKNIFGYAATMDECTEFYRATSIDPLIMVPPTIALSETISMFVIHPSILMAESMQKITRILFGNQMWGMYIGTPLVMIIFGGMFLFMFVMVTGRRLKLKIMYLGSFEVGGQFENFYPPLNRAEYAQIKQSPVELEDLNLKSQKPVPLQRSDNTTTASSSIPETNTSTSEPSRSTPTRTGPNPSTAGSGHPSCSATLSSCCPVPCQPVSCVSHAHAHTGHPPAECQFHSSVTRFPIWGAGHTKRPRDDVFRNPMDSFQTGSRRRMSPLGDRTNYWANVDNERPVRQRRGVSNRNEDVEDTFVMIRRRKVSI